MIWLVFTLITAWVLLSLFTPLLRSNRIMVIALMIMTMAVAAGLYLRLGAPDMIQERQAALQASSMPAPTPASMNALVEQLKTRLIETGSQDPKGWLLLARSQMRLGQYEAALQSYATAIDLDGPDSPITAERDEVRAFIDQRQKAMTTTRGPTPEDIANAAQMSDEARNAMILSMVDNLSQKLSSNPDNVSGWIQLLSARKVLGQNEKARVEIAKMRKFYIQEPDTIQAILAQSGWDMARNTP